MDPHVLLVVRLRELLLGVDDLVVAAGAAVRGTGGFVDQVDLHRLEWVVFERGARVGHLRRFLEVDGVTLVRRAEFLEAVDDLELHAARVHRVVVGDLGPLVLEEHAAIGHVQRQRHLSVAFVGAIPEAQEAAAVAFAVKEVEVHALVEIGFRAQGVGVVVLGRDVTEYRDHVRLHVLSSRISSPAAPTGSLGQRWRWENRGRDHAMARPGGPPDQVVCLVHEAMSK